MSSLLNTIIQRLRRTWPAALLGLSLITVLLASVSVIAWPVAWGFSGLAILVICVVALPDWFVSRDIDAASLAGLRASERLEAKNNIRTTLVQAVGGLLLLGGAFFTWQQLQIAQEGQITERFTRAINQIGSKNLHVRLGGIYALERIARTSEADRGAIAEVLTAYIRERCPWPPREGSGCGGIKQPESTLGSRALDVQAALKVLGGGHFVEPHLTSAHYSIDLQNVDLRGADLDHAQLQHSNLRDAHLEDPSGRAIADRRLNSSEPLMFEGPRVVTGTGANFCNLSDATLTNANLSGALLSHANLSNAILQWANLSGTFLVDANLSNAALDGARLSNAQLSKADLSLMRRFWMLILLVQTFSVQSSKALLPMATRNGLPASTQQRLALSLYPRADALVLIRVLGCGRC
jgi:hypothetical protein